MVMNASSSGKSQLKAKVVMVRRVVVNADDFGFDGRLNRAILDSFSFGLCSSTTIMTNMPGFEEACEMVHEQALLHHVGVHLVLTLGSPLTDAIRSCRRFCDSDGQFRLARERRFIWLGRTEREAVAGELLAQIQRCRDHGISPTHVDSHHHVHEEPGLLPLVIAACKAARIPVMRLAKNCGFAGSRIKRLYRHYVNRRVRLSGLAGTVLFGNLADWKQVSQVGTNAESMEIMVHPNYAGDVLVDTTLGLTCSLSQEMSALGLISRGESFSGAKYGI